MLAAMKSIGLYSFTIYYLNPYILNPVYVYRDIYNKSLQMTLIIVCLQSQYLEIGPEIIFFTEV